MALFRRRPRLRPPRRRATDDAARLADRLKVCLMNSEAYAALPVELVSEPVAEGLVSVLVADLPTAVQTIDPGTAAVLGRRDALFSAGMARLRAEERFDDEGVEDFAGAEVEVRVGDDYFVASHALRLQEIVDVPPAGALVGVPHRHALLVHPMRDQSAVLAIGSLLRVIGDLYDRGPGRLSRNLYWHHDGALHHLPARVLSDSIRFEPPDAFMMALDDLPE